MAIDLDRAAVGLPITRMGVSLFPLYLHQRAPLIASGRVPGLTVEELPAAEVPVVRLGNASGVPVLVPAGTVVEGGRQNRVLTTSVLVPAATVLDVPVSCVQAGRWSGMGTFGLAASMAPRRVRRASTASVRDQLNRGGQRRADQGRVWAEVDAELERNGVRSPDRDLLELARAREHDAAWRAAVDELVARGPLPGQVGIVVAHGARVVAADLFATPDLLAVNWEALVRSHLGERVAPPHTAPSATRALTFLRRFASAPSRVVPGAGLGREQHVDDPRIAGQALVLDDVLVHASAFALAA